MEEVLYRSTGRGVGAPAPARKTRTASGGAPRVNVMLQALRVLNNKKLFGAANLHLTTIVVDGRGDVAKKEPFWTIQHPFVGIKDGDDPIAGAPLLLYDGTPKHFLNVALLLSRSQQAGRDFAAALRKGLGEKGIGNVVDGALSFTPAGLAADAVAAAVTSVIGTTLAVFEARPDSMIGVHYLSLLEKTGYSVGRTLPEGYPPKGYVCSNAVEVAYQVL